MKKNMTKFINDQAVKREWYLIDASEFILGRMASKIAIILRGKHKSYFSPQADCGDFVVVVNAAKVKVTADKVKQKTYFTHSGYPGGDKLLTLEDMLKRHPAQVVRNAVAGMLPKSRLGKRVIGKLKVYAAESHPHQAQKLKKLEV